MKVPQQLNLKSIATLSLIVVLSAVAKDDADFSRIVRDAQLDLDTPLKGLKPLKYKLIVTDDLEKKFSAKVLTDRTEALLRKFGVPLKDRASAVFKVKVSGLQSASGNWAYTIIASVEEFVLPTRDTEPRVISAITWQDTNGGTLGRDVVDTRLPERVDELVMSFINEWLKANPPR